ncbi:MAG: aminopeptidase P family N-terminal domain-containing protein, partial [Paracoccaceae bacterium]
MERPAQYRLHNGTKAPLPFAPEEYQDRLSGLRDIMELHSLDAVVLTSMHNVAYYSGFLYCTFGRPYACVVTPTQCVTISAGIDAGQPWRRSIEDNITYTDWTRDNFWRAVTSVTGTGKAIGCEADHLTMDRAEKFNAFLQPKRGMDIAPATMAQRMVKSPAEIALIKHGANVADIGGYAIRDAIREGVTELEVSIAGRDAMERE